MTSITIDEDPVLSRFAAALRDAYGDRLDRLVLFGSRARGEARPDSDYDVAVFLNDRFAFGKESGTLALIETNILYETGVIINAMPFQADSYGRETSFMREVRRDGIEL